MKIVVVFIGLIISSAMSGQLVVDSELTVEQVVLGNFLGNNLPVSNIIYNGAASNMLSGAVAGFECTDCNVEVTSGMIISTGLASTAIGPNNSNAQSHNFGLNGLNDPDMDMAIGANPLDWSIIEFDFVASSNLFDLSYVWASEEYSNYVGSSFADGFAILLSGPGLTGPFSNNAINIALIPGTSIPVTINNLNNGYENEGPCENCEYFNQESVLGVFDPSSDWYTDPHFVQFNGYTDVMHAIADVVCGELYHIKMMIADRGDSSFDSAIFLQTTNLNDSSSANLTLDFSPGGPNGVSLYENCGEGIIRIERPEASSLTDQLTINLAYSGSAVFATDYSNLPSVISIEPGEAFVEIEISAIDDGIPEEDENVIVTAYFSSDCDGLSSVSSLEFEIADEGQPLVTIDPNITVCLGNEVTLIPEFTGGSGGYSIAWSTGEDSDSLVIEVFSDVVMFYTVSDVCGLSASGQISIDAFEPQPLLVNIVDLGNDIPLGCGDVASLEAQVSGGLLPYEYVYFEDDGDILAYVPWVYVGTASSGTMFLEVVDQCGDTMLDSIEVTLTIPEFVVSTPSELHLECEGEFQVQTTVTGVQGGLSYVWYWNGEFLPNFSSIYNGTATSSGVLTAEVSNWCGQQEEAHTNIVIEFDTIEVVVINSVSGCPGFVLSISPEILIADPELLNFYWNTSEDVLSDSMNFEGTFQESVALYLVVTDNCNNTLSTDEIDVLIGAEVICPADYDSNGIVTSADLIMFLGEYGCQENCCPYDLSNDGAVSVVDLILFIAYFSNICN